MLTFDNHEHDEPSALRSPFSYGRDRESLIPMRPQSNLRMEYRRFNGWSKCNRHSDDGFQLRIEHKASRAMPRNQAGSPLSNDQITTVKRAPRHVDGFQLRIEHKVSRVMPMNQARCPASIDGTSFGK